MSNQVYRNDLFEGKYYDFPGIDNWLLSANSVNIQTGGVLQIDFDTENPNAFNDDTVMTKGISSLIVNRKGMYGINCIVGLTAATTPDTTPINYLITILLERPGQFVDLPLCQQKGIYVPAADDPNGFVISLTPTCFLNVSDIIKFQVKNTTTLAPQSFFVDKAYTQLSVSKLY